MRSLLAAALTSCLSLGSAHAAVTSTDLQVAARALTFMQKPLAGEVSTGIVYVPGNPQSTADAQQLQKLLGDGLRVGTVTLKPVLVKSTDVATASVMLFFLTEGAAQDGAKVAGASHARHIPCVTADIAQVKNGSCVMGVRSSPKIEILVNRAAAAASGVQFSAMFRMMITEL